MAQESVFLTSSVGHLMGKTEQWCELLSSLKGSDKGCHVFNDLEKWELNSGETRMG